MADVFWLGGFSVQGGWREGLRSLGVKPDWVQETHVSGSAPGLAFETVFAWPDSAGSTHRLLHFACQALRSTELDLLLLASSDQAAVLASPRAAGRWNLLPRASLSARFSYPPGAPPDQFLPALAVQLLAVEIDPAQAGCAATLHQPPFALAPAFPAMEWLPGEGSDGIERLNRLCATLEERSLSLGLLLTPGLATVIERL